MPADSTETNVLDGVNVTMSGTPNLGPERVARFVLAHTSTGTDLVSLSYANGGWTALVRNLSVCVTSVPIDCRTFPTAYFLINDRMPLRISGWGVP